MRRSTPHKLFVGVFLTFSLLAVGAWILHSYARNGEMGQQQSGEQTRALSYAEYSAEYQNAVKSLEWPSGDVPSSEPMNHDQHGLYEVGAGEGDAVARFQCSWGKDYLDHHASNPKKASQALTRWASVKQMAAWDRSLSDPHTREVIEEAIEKARLGDSSGIAELVKANC